MRKAFLKFMEQVMTYVCPFYTFSVSIYKSFIEVKFIIATSVRPEVLGWLNTHLIGGQWYIISENDSISLVVRFDNENED